jgi:predicted extracellular nuclease
MILAASDPSIELVAEATLPGDLEIDRTLVGGLSGLTYDPVCDLFYAISDDRGSIDPPRFYTLKIRFDGDAAEVAVLGATLLRDADGAPFARGSLDPEGLALAPDGALFVASEGEPHRGIPPLVARFMLDGSLVAGLKLPEHYLPNSEGTWGVRDNLAFEGLGMSPDGSRLVVATENALLQDGPAADLDHGSPARLLVLEPTTGLPIAEYLYEVGAVPDMPHPSTALSTNGISEILALDNNRLLIVERSFSAGVGNRVRIYLVDLEGASNIKDIDSLRDTSGSQPVAAAKILLADLGMLGIEPDNIEGMALGPALPDGRRLLVLASDNNFQPLVQRNQVVLLAISGVALPATDVPVVRIGDIQGRGQVSPFVGRCVTGVTGVVTAILGNRDGQAFWVQDPEGDGDRETSDGLFVTTGEDQPLVAVGDLVRLEGRVEEPSWGLELPVTRIFASEVEMAERGIALPPPVTLGAGGLVIPQPEIAAAGLQVFDPSRYAADAFETVEGMRVRVEEPVVVGPTSNYGEIVVLGDGGRGSGPWTARGGLRLQHCNSHPQRIIVDDRLLGDPPLLVVGDSLSGSIEGILHFSFGSYKLLNTTPLAAAAEAGGLERERTALEGGTERLTVATANLENLSAVSPDKKFGRLAMVVAGDLGSPDILAVQELQDDTGPENDGTVSSERTLARLVAAIEVAGGPRYATRVIDPSDNADGGQFGANIRTAFLFNPTRVEFVDREGCGDGSAVAVTDDSSLSCNPGLVDPGNPAFGGRNNGHGGSRKPLVGEFRFAGERVVVVNLHLSSKGGDDPPFGRRQPPLAGSTRLRTDQARVVAGFVEELTRTDASARVVVLGDLNDFEDTEPLRVLEAVGLEDLIKRLPPDERYTYVYLGTSQVLDHVLVSPTLADGAEIDVVHVNAEFPAADRASDHDPVIVGLAFQR